MQGLTYVIDKLGQSLADAEGRLAQAAQAAQENEVLRARVSELEAAAKAEPTPKPAS